MWEEVPPCLSSIPTRTDAFLLFMVPGGKIEPLTSDDSESTVLIDGYHALDFQGHVKTSRGMS
jgi:hypothetical protein